MTSTSNCLGWMLNQEGQPPCVIAQEVGRLCDQEYTVSTANYQESHYVPNATTANGCTCSWSIYNLLSAYSYCVDQSQYLSWSTWITSCGSYASNVSYLPSGLTLSQGIPFWAATNPFNWENAVFNITQAADIAEQVKPDVTGGPPSTSTTASSSSRVSVGAIVGGVIGGIIFLIIGWLLIFWTVRRRRRQRTYTAPTRVPSFNTSQPVTMSSTWTQTPVQPTSSRRARASSVPVTPYLALPIQSTTNLAPTMLIPQVSPGFSVSGHSTAPPITDAADMITPFLATSSMHPAIRANMSPPLSKASEALSERVMAPPEQRARLNPPPYTASVEPGSSGAATTRPRRLSTKKQKRRHGSSSGTTTTHSEHSRPSTGESATTIAHTGLRREQSRSHLAAPGMGTVLSVKNALGAGGLGSIDGGDDVEMTHGWRAGESDQHPPAV